MFNDINEVRLMGNITNEPELRFTPSGSAVLSFGMATNRRYKKNDEWVDEPTYSNIVVWGQYAQSLAPRIKKGTRIYVSGRIQVRTWDGADGRKQYKTEIVADGVELIARYNEGPASELASVTPQPAPVAEAKAPVTAEPGPDVEVDTSIDPDDLPF